MHKLSLFVFSIMIICVATNIVKPASNENPVQFAVHLFQMGETKTAIATLEALCKKDPYNVLAHQFLGLFYYEQEDWENAVEYMERTLELDSGNVDAKLVLAKSYREKGYFSSFVTRNLFWNKADNYFQSVLSVDSTISNVLLEYSILKKYQGDYWQAIDLLQQQLKYYPDDLDAFYSMYFCYDAICFTANNNDVELLKSKSELSLYFLGECYRQHGMVREAETIFQSFISSPAVSHSAVFLSLAKTAFQQQDNDLAEYYYNLAIDFISSQQDATLLFHDIKYIFSDAELLFYKNLTNYNQVKNFFNKSWLRRNPVPASSHNARIIEHLRRCDYAEKNYRKYRVGKNRWQATQTDILKYPQIYDMADRYDDRGLVYIRYGAPSQISGAVDGKPGANAAVSSNGWSSTLFGGESWLYQKTEFLPQMIFHFYRENEDLKLVPIMPLQMLQDCINWDKRYFYLFSSRDATDFAQLSQEMIIQNKKLIYSGLQTDNFQLPENENKIKIPYYLASFQHNLIETNYELYYNLASEFVSLITEIPSLEPKMALNFQIFDKNWNVVYQEKEQLPLSDIINTIDTLGYWPGQINFTLKNDQYYYTCLSAEIPELKKIGGIKIKSVPTPYPANNVYMSDLEPAWNIQHSTGKGPFYKNNLLVIPKADRIFKQNKPLFVYFELYNLPLGAQNSIEYTIQYKVKLIDDGKRGLLNNLANLFSADKNELSVTSEGYANSTHSVENIGLDLNKLEPGVYNLEIMVTAPQHDIKLSKAMDVVLQ